MKVWVFTPIYRLEPETVQALMALENDGPLALHLQRDNPFSDGRENVTHQYREGRKMFLASGYDAMLVIESDIIPPPDTIKRLDALRADVAFGHYAFRASGATNVLSRYPTQTQRNIGESLSTWSGSYKAALRDGHVECTGGGLGCVLIRRAVLERFDFHHPPADANGGYCDWWFHTDVLAAGLTQRADLWLVCGHKDTDGRIIWPKRYRPAVSEHRHPAPTGPG